LLLSQPGRLKNALAGAIYLRVSRKH